MTLNRFARFAVAAVIAATPFQALAHRQWIMPSETVLSGDDAWVGFDAAVSSELFYADHNPLKLDGLAVTLPDGSAGAAENAFTGQYRIVFDVHLTQPGTYRIASASNMLMASYKQNGEQKRWRGTKEELATAIPADATDVEITEGQNRVETFVTRGKPTTGALNPSNSGLELVPVTHPNDLFAGETATFKLLVDGQPAKGLEVIVAPGGSRYRDGSAQTKVTTGDDGSFQVTWPAPGLYWINASLRDLPSTAIEGAKRRVGYSAVLEVLN